MHLYGRGVESRARQPLRVWESYDSTYYVYETRPSETPQISSKPIETYAFCGSETEDV